MRIIIWCLFVFLFSCTSCSESHPSGDNESNGGDDIDMQNDADISDSDADYSADSDDQDDNKPDEVPDIDEDTNCPPLKEAGFPYSRDDGSIHFCRGCDKPAENDPDCTVNLWKEANDELCTKKPEYDCCGYPCVMDNLTPSYLNDENRTGYFFDKCDMVLNANYPRGWQTGPRFFKHYNMSEGKVGIVMDLTKTFGYSNNTRAFEFDIATRKYKVLMQNDNNAIINYHKGASFQTVTENGIKDDSTYSYLVYSDKEGNRKVVYDKRIRWIFLEPVMNGKWVFMNVEETDYSGRKMMYAKIGEWKWTVLGAGTDLKVLSRGITGDLLPFYDNDFNGFVCDLSKNPKSREDCLKLNREGESLRYPVINQDNPNIVYYENIEKSINHRIIKADISKTPIEYEEIKIPGLYEWTIAISINQVKNNIILLGNVHLPNNNYDEQDNKLCYYRIDTKKTYCSLPTPHYEENKMLNLQSMGEFEGHWLIWEDTIQPVIKLRDMECYCDHHPEICPFDDYTPQPDNPKDVETGKRLKE
ncbi:MAG: hypothetical protein ACOX2F_12815 [bacterium]